MNIRREQMETIIGRATGRFEERLTTFLRDRFPDASEADRAELAAFVRSQNKKAGSYGLETEIEIATYATTAWMLGADFDTEFPAAQDALTSRAPSARKADWLAQWTEDLFEALDAGR